MIFRAVSTTAFLHDLAERHQTARSFAAQAKIVLLLLVPLPLQRITGRAGGGYSNSPSKYDHYSYTHQLATPKITSIIIMTLISITLSTLTTTIIILVGSLGSRSRAALVATMY